jgi:hypothetical protein
VEALRLESLGLEACEEFPEKPDLGPGTKGEVGTADHRFAQRTGGRTPARTAAAAGGVSGAPTPVKPRLLFGRPASSQARACRLIYPWESLSGASCT